MAKPRIRIIDDDEESCSEIADALMACGYDCSWANPPDFMAGPNEPAPDILILDLSMPRIDGFQVIQNLAGAGRQPHLIVASGHEQRIIRAAVRSAQEAGLHVLGALEKPYSIASLLALVESRMSAPAKTADNHAALIAHLVDTQELTSHVQTAFQSKHRLSNGDIVGYEALLRISVNGRSINPEAMFAPIVALRDQLAVTRTVLDDALRFGSNLRSAGRSLPVAVNCTPALLCAPDFQDVVVSALGRWNMPASSLMIEITEHETIYSFDALATAASRLALRDCGISIDDFGRGATSLERLFDLPLTELKIDKEIFWKCVDGREPPALLKEVVRYCKDRNITSTIEGIETAKHLEYAVAMGACNGQGYLWGKPSLDTKSLLKFCSTSSVE